MKEQHDLIAELKERGIRVTPQRSIILEAIESLPGHVTAEEVFKVVQGVNAYVSLATVYRTLDLLRDLGLVTEAHLSKTGMTHYALSTHGTHHHAICRVCDQSMELPQDFYDPLTERLHQDYGFIADTNHLIIFGQCANCQIQS